MEKFKGTVKCEKIIVVIMGELYLGCFVIIPFAEHTT